MSLKIYGRVFTTLFKINLNEALRRWRRFCSRMGIQLNDDKTLYTLHFADNQVVITQNKEDLKSMTIGLIKEYAKWRLVVNRVKTKYLYVGYGTGNRNLGDGETIGHVTTILGNVSTGRTENEIEQRILKKWEGHKMSELDFVIQKHFV